MTESYSASDSRHFETVDASWGAYRRAIDRLARELGEIKTRQSWVQALDRSVTPSREALDDAVAVLEADGLEFNYSFTSLTSVDGAQVSIFVWKERQRVMITARASSASRAKGLVALGMDLLEQSPGAARKRAGQVLEVTPDAVVTELQLPERKPRWPWLVALGALAVGAIVGGVVGIPFGLLGEWAKRLVFGE